MPHTLIDVAAQWTKTGWHGGVSGGQLHWVTTVAAGWVPLAAEVTAAHAADNEIAFEVREQRRAEVRFLLGETS